MIADDGAVSYVRRLLVCTLNDASVLGRIWHRYYSKLHAKYGLKFHECHFSSCVSHNSIFIRAFPVDIRWWINRLFGLLVKYYRQDQTGSPTHLE
jgi:hypothetical protein